MIGETSVRRQLAGLVMTAGIGAAIIGIQGLATAQPWVKVYNSSNAGLVVGFGNSMCVGVEVKGSPGVFGSFTDASACDY
jgi:hypothetical protein